MPIDPYALQQHPLMRMLIHGVPLGRLFRIEIRVHFVLILMVLFLFAREAAEALRQGYNVPLALLLAAVVTVILYGSILLHELGHCYGAYLVGGIARSILLWPLGGLATVQGANRTPKTDLVVTALGPAVSLLLALLFTGIYYALPVPQSLAADLVWYACRMALFINWGLFLFNMLLPLLPLDCAALLRAGFSLRYPAEMVTYRLCIVGFWTAGIVFALAIVFTHMVSNILLLIAIFGAFECWRTLQALQYGEVYQTERWAYGYQQTVTSPVLPRGLTEGWRRLIRRWFYVPVQRKEAGPSRKRPAVVVPLSEVERLQQELDEAVAKEEYERAARLRDRIRQVKSGKAG